MQHLPLRRLALALLTAFANTAAAQPGNLSFERHANSWPTGWGGGGDGFNLAVDTTAPFSGAVSMRSRYVRSTPYPGNGAGVVTVGFPVALARGRMLHLTGYIRTENITNGYAGLWMRVDGGGRYSLSFDNMLGRGPRGTTPWTRYDIQLPVDSGATSVVFGALHAGDGTAWFDSLNYEVVGPAMPRKVPDNMPPRPPSAPSFRPEPRPIENMTRLLSDAELALPPDTAPPPAENDVWTTWVKANAQPIRSLGATDFSDLRFFEPLLAGKRIVQLGESGHGVAEFDLAKVRLIKYLHEELGYDVIAFESSVFECNRAQRAIATLRADELMRNCIFGVWHTQEVVPLFEYIKQTQSTARPLILAGFDEQTSAITSNVRPVFFFNVVSTLDSAYAREVARRDSSYLAMFRATDKAPVARDLTQIVAFYDSLAKWIKAREPQLVSRMRDDPQAPAIARQTAISMTFFARQNASYSESQAGRASPLAGSNIRDLGMANNLDFLLDEMFPQKKIMVWAHNFHIEHREGVVTGDAAGMKPKTMGVYVAERHRKELYTIGLFMYRGSAALNTREPYAIKRGEAGSLESIMHRVPWKYSYIDVSKATNTPGTSWMFQPIPTFEWGMNRDPLVLKNEYDGILFIDTTHPPQYWTGPPPRAQ